MAGGRFAGAAALSRIGSGTNAGRPLDHFTHASADRTGNPSGGFRLGAGTAGRGGLVERQDDWGGATTLEANAARRSIVRRDNGQGYQEFLVQLAQESGIQTPTREQLARLDRKRKKKGSNEDWVSPHHPDARITKMKDGRTHLAHKAEHAVDLDTGAVVAVVLARADEGDTTTIRETVPEAGMNIAEAAGATVANAEAKVELTGPVNVIGDKGYHSNESLKMLGACEVRSYISEPDRGRRCWQTRSGSTAGGVWQPATNRGRSRQGAVAAWGRTGRTQLRPCL